MRYKICNQKEAINTNNTIFLIYTMVKVASMSVLDTITHRLPHVSTFAMHYMNPVNLQREEDKLSSSTHIDNQFYSKIHTLHAQKIEKYIESNPQKQKKIITIESEPISQIISLIFQQLNLSNLDKLE